VGVLLAFNLRAGREAWVALVVATAVQPLAALAAAYAGKLLVDGALAQDGGQVLAAAGLGAVAGAAAILCGEAGLRLTVRNAERSTALVDRHLIDLIAGIPGLAHLERPDVADQVALVRGYGRHLASVTNALGNNLRVWVSLLGSAVLLWGLYPPLVLLPLFGLGSFVTGQWGVAVQRRLDEAAAEPGRLKRHLFDLATSAGPGKEVRVFGLAAELVARHRALSRRLRGAATRAAWGRAALEVAGSLCFAVGYVATVAVVLVRAVNGQATPGDVVLALGLAAQLNGAIATAVGLGNYLAQVLTSASRYLWLVDYAAGARLAPADPAPVPDRLAGGLALEGVTFRYPGTDAPALEDVSLRLPAGAVVALVGENGAGKTTLVKLLCRLYEPEAGRITADGTDLRRFDVAAWRARLSAGFQDFCRFELLAAETVGVGDLPRLGEAPALADALGRAGAADVVAALPRGLRTQLGSSWEGGVDLSGGQWQKLALARALMRQAPLLTVFDEPTAALDAPTEHALFERFAAAAGSGDSRGAVTVLVSHRFSTVRMADLIVVLDGGRIREVGSHEALVAAGGLYAELYELQAARYR
jgi:ATP-binding cassette subfamily B protein